MLDASADAANRTCVPNQRAILPKAAWMREVVRDAERL